jgi:hypothetical protein
MARSIVYPSRASYLAHFLIPALVICVRERVITARDKVIGPKNYRNFCGFRFLSADAGAGFGRNVMKNDPTTGDEAWRIGEWSQTIPVESGDPIKMKGFWSTIDIRQGEEWKMRMLTWNITPETPTVNNN